MDVRSYLPDTSLSSVEFSSFLGQFREKLDHIFNGRASQDELSRKRGVPPFVMREIRSCNPLSVYIPEEYGGRGGHIHEGQAVLAEASYQSLALSLTIGINGALFLQPFTKYGKEEAKADVFQRFLAQDNMGGLMITEPDFGTDALNMETSYEETASGDYRIQGMKHWGGLTGWADFWLVAARRKTKNGLGRDIDFFLCDMNDDSQRIEVEELYENMGLYLIPYGRNRLDVTVPKSHHLQPESTGIKMMLDMLHRSRTQFPGMGMGFLRRMVDEAMTHCKERLVGGKSLFNYDQVKARLSRLQAAYTTCSAMCTYTSEHADLDQNLAAQNVAANAIKAHVTDMMHDASQSLLQLTGAQGYQMSHIAGRSLVDSRPFQIFEGSNDVLYQQIADGVLKSMRRMKKKNLHDYLSSYELTERAAGYFEDALDFEVDQQMSQRKTKELGEMLSRLISMELTLELGDRGFRSDLIADALTVLQRDAEQLLSGYKSTDTAEPAEDYAENSSWLDFVRC